MKIQSFDNVWDAISDTPEEAENMKLRSQLMIVLKEYIARRALSGAEAAALLGVSQPRISELQQGKINLFSIDKLVTMMASAGLQIGHIEIIEPKAA